VNEFLASYEAFLTKQGRPRISILTHLNPLRKLASFAEEKELSKPKQITVEVLKEFQKFYLEKRDFKVETVAMYMLFIRLFFDFLILNGVVKDNPAEGIEILQKPEPPQTQLAHFYTFEEILRRYIADQKEWVSFAYASQVEKHLKGFFRYLLANDVKSIYSVTESTLLKYREYLWDEFVEMRTDALVVKSQISRLCCMVKLFRYLYREGILKEDPARHLAWKAYYPEILEKARHLPARPKVQEDLTEMEKLKEKFLEYESSRGKAAQTCQGYHKALSVFFDFLKGRGVENIAQVNKRLLLDYYMFLCRYVGVRGEPASNGYKATLLFGMRLFFRFLVRFDYLAKDPSTDLEGIRYQDGLPRTYMNEKEIFELLEKPKLNGDPLTVRDKAIMEVLFSTGIRSNELHSLNIEDIDQQQGLIRINHPKGGVGQQRVIPIGKTALDYLNLYLTQARPRLENGDPTALFLSYTGHRLDNYSILCIVKKYVFQCGFRKPITTHSLRVTCATLMLKNGADIRYVQEQLGHKRITSTQVYTRLTPLDLKSIHTRCHPRERKNFEGVKAEAPSEAPSGDTGFTSAA